MSLGSTLGAAEGERDADLRDVLPVGHFLFLAFLKTEYQMVV